MIFGNKIMEEYLNSFHSNSLNKLYIIAASALYTHYTHDAHYIHTIYMLYTHNIHAI